VSKQTRGEKPCDRCTTPVSLRYRCQYNDSDHASKTWQLICPSCWEQVSQDNPHYRYGGTWKAKKKP